MEMKLMKSKMMIEVDRISISSRSTHEYSIDGAKIVTVDYRENESTPIFALPLQKKTNQPYIIVRYGILSSIVQDSPQVASHFGDSHYRNGILYYKTNIENIASFFEPSCCALFNGSKDAKMRS